MDDLLKRVRKGLADGTAAADDIDEVISLVYELRRENELLLARRRESESEADKRKERVREILAEALSGSTPRYRTAGGFVRWGKVERDILNELGEYDEE